MSSSNATSDLIISLTNASNALNRYLPIFIYAFGIFGNLMNILVLSQRTLRSNSTVIFFIVSSIAGLIAIISGLTSRMMSGYATDLTLTVGWICKLRNSILYSARTMNLMAIALATVDRWLLSNTEQNFRQMSTLKNARWALCIALIYTCIFNTPIIFCYEANLSNSTRACYGSNHVCSLVTDLIYAICTTTCPLFLMVLFGFMIINNIRHVRRRVATMTGTAPGRTSRSTGTNTNRNGPTNSRKVDQTLLRMLFIQVGLLVLLTFPHAIQKLYSSFTPSPPAKSLESAIETLTLDLFTLLTFVASGMPFYIYTLSGGSVFRSSLINMIKKIF